jgi:uncharacterized membrane-anchored protein YitT (DUF2179 family)
MIGKPYQFVKYYFKSVFWFVIGAFLAALGVEALLIPNQLIDGGTVGLAMMASHLLGSKLLPLFLVLFNLPFVILAYKHIGKHFVIQMCTAVLIFAVFLWLFTWVPNFFDIAPFEFHGETIEVIVLAGFIIGCGVGIIIRHGGSTDGTEIMGIIINQKRGFTVGQVILFSNVFIFALAGFVYHDWHTAILSLLTYVVATKVMDMVIVGFEDTKSVKIISSMPDHLTKVLLDELGVGLTVMYGKGGFSGEPCQVLYIVVERLQLAELKEIVHREDPTAFIAIENLHEVINGRKTSNLAYSK